MFVCLLIFQIRGRVHAGVALISGILSVIISLALPGNFHILIASFIAASAGLFLHKGKKWGAEKKRMS